MSFPGWRWERERGSRCFRLPFSFSGFSTRRVIPHLDLEKILAISESERARANLCWFNTVSLFFRRRPSFALLYYELWLVKVSGSLSSGNRKIPRRIWLGARKSRGNHPHPYLQYKTSRLKKLQLQNGNVFTCLSWPLSSSPLLWGSLSRGYPWWVLQYTEVGPSFVALLCSSRSSLSCRSLPN